MLSEIVGFDGSCLSGLSLRTASHAIVPAVAEESGKWSRQMLHAQAGEPFATAAQHLASGQMQRKSGT